MIAKGLANYIRELNIDAWEADTQYQAEESSHELASLLLTECIQHSLYIAKSLVFILYLDAKSAFNNLLRQLLVRKLFFAGTSGQTHLYINDRLESRATFLDWDKQIMGPILDVKGVEPGAVNSDHLYKIFGKDLLTICHSSKFGIFINGLVTSAIA